MYDKATANIGYNNLKIGVSNVLQGSYAKVSGTAKSTVAYVAMTESASAASGALSSVVSVGAAIAALAFTF